MADLSVTSTSVVWVSGTAPQIGTAGASLTRGQAIVLTGGVWKLADANGVAAIQTAGGICLTDVTVGQQLMVALPGAIINCGATIAAGTVAYVLSATPGGIAPIADATTGWLVGIIGVGVTTSNMQLIFNNTGVQL